MAQPFPAHLSENGKMWQVVFELFEGVKDGVKEFRLV